MSEHLSMDDLLWIAGEHRVAKGIQRACCQDAPCYLSQVLDEVALCWKERDRLEKAQAALREIRDFWPGYHPDEMDFRVLQGMAERALKA